MLPLLSAASVLQATAQTRATRPEPVCTTESDGRVECRVVRTGVGRDSMFRLLPFRQDSAMIKRAALGLELRPTGTRRDTLGVFVAAVTPKGPAETAGIFEGDRIAAINGVDLRVPAADVDDAYTNGLASHRLTREVRKLAPGSRVNLRVYSGGRYREVAVTAGRASDLFRNTMRFRAPTAGRAFEFQGPGAVQLRESFPRAPMMREGTPPARVRIRRPDGVRTLPRAPEGAPQLYIDEMVEADELIIDSDGEFEGVEFEEVRGT